MPEKAKTTADDLLKMKKEVQDKEDKIKVLQGKEAANLERLKKEFSISSVEEAEKKIKKLEEDLKRRDEVFSAKVEKLKSNYPWDCFA